VDVASDGQVVVLHLDYLSLACERLDHLQGSAMAYSVTSNIDIERNEQNDIGLPSGRAIVAV
jgi:hypothetical protein